MEFKLCRLCPLIVLTLSFSCVSFDFLLCEIQIVLTFSFCCIHFDFFNFCRLCPSILLTLSFYCVDFKCHIPDFLRDFFVKPSLINISQKYVSTPQMLGTNIRVELNILGFTHIPELVPPPPQCLARKSGLNDIYWVVHTSQESVSLQQGDDAFQCDICGNSFSSDKGLRIHKGRSHKSQDLLQPEQMRSQDFVNSKNVSPLKDVREEEVTNTQVFQCDAFDSMNHVHCGEVFESEDTLEDHTGILGPFVRCPGCKHFFYDCDDAEACPGCLRPWPGWRSRPR